jgi:hypothetical protein
VLNVFRMIVGAPPSSLEKPSAKCKDEWSKKTEKSLIFF